MVNWRAGETFNTRDEAISVYQYSYRSIGIANQALQKIEELGLQESLRPARGEALVARAYGHFNLVTTFSEPYRSSTSARDLGMPYLVAEETAFLPRAPRGTVAEVYQKIEQDLLEGIPLLDDNVYNKTTAKYHFTERAALAFAARFFLYYNKWDLAEEYATRLLGTGDPTPQLRDWRNFGNQPRNNEDAYALEYTRIDSPANLLLLSAESSATNYLSRRANNSSRYSHGNHVSDRETYRAANIWGVWGQGQQDPYYMVPFINSETNYDTSLMPKMPSFRGITGRTIFVPFTTEETLLVRAEARIMQGKYDEAMQDLNYWSANYINPGTTSPRQNTWTRQEVIDFYNGIDYSEGLETTLKKRLNPDFTITAGEQEALLHHVLQCRRILTLHEGLRWQDVRRYGIEVVRHVKQDDGTFALGERLPFPDNRRTIQIPREVISAGMPENPR